MSMNLVFHKAQEMLLALADEFSSQSSQMAMQVDDVYLGSRERTVKKLLNSY
jgi:hypothetical protein